MRRLLLVLRCIVSHAAGKMSQRSRAASVDPETLGLWNFDANTTNDRDLFSMGMGTFFEELFDERGG